MAVTPVDLSVTNITATSVRLNWVAVDALQALINSLFGAGEQGAIYIPMPIVLGTQALFQDSAGTVPVTADGDPIGLMQDKSGNNNHASQAVSSERMLHKETNSLLQDQVDDNVTITGLNLTPASGFKTWTLCVSYSELGSERIILLGDNSKLSKWVGIGDNGNASGNIAGSSITQDIIWFDGVLSTPGTRSEMWALMVSSSVIVIEFTVESGSANWDKPVFGKGSNFGFYGPRISEFLLLHEGALTESERKNVESYAAGQAGTIL